MNFSVCLIDDQLLQADRGSHILTQCQIQDKLENIAPSDTEEAHLLNLKSFIVSMITAPDLTLYGYSNPVLYNNNIGIQPAFDVVIFDWEYGQLGHTINVSEQLKKLLDESHCQVYIYSHMPDSDVLQTIADIKHQYEHRLHFLQKAVENSDNILRNKIIELRDSGNFSTTFSRGLRVNARKSVEKILVKLSHLDIERFHQIMGTKNEEKRKDIAEFISEKFKNELMQMDFSFPLAEDAQESESATVPEAVETITSPDLSIKELWHYRLYSTITDDRVRKGDIYKKEDSDDYLLIMTPNCQLVSYHDNKTFGVLNYMHMTSTDSLRTMVDRLVSQTSEGGQTINNFKSKKANSLINQVAEKDSAPFVLPYVVIEEVRGDDNLVLFPKMYGYKEIQALKKNRENYLRKSELEGYKYITSLSEPFLTELTNEIYSKLQGNGVPDYTNPVKDEILSFMNEAVRRS